MRCLIYQTCSQRHEVHRPGTGRETVLHTTWSTRVEKKNRHHIDGLVQDCSNSSANALELLQSCAKPSKSTQEPYWGHYMYYHEDYPLYSLWPSESIWQHIMVMAQRGRAPPPPPPPPPQIFPKSPPPNSLHWIYFVENTYNRVHIWCCKYISMVKTATVKDVPINNDALLNIQACLIHVWKNCICSPIW